jgi:molecular chaperone DnaK (HSP70)
MSNRAVGIDLGTTYSALAVVNQHGVPEVIANAEGERITPSVILFDGDDIVVGSYAKQAAVAYPDQVVDFVKRHMGDPDYGFSYRNEIYSPPKLSSFILEKLKHDAEVRLGHPIHEAVITVPAYFGDQQRKATLRAGEMAGLKVLKLVNEPTAAAFAYGLANAGRDMTVMVFDLGGGTFDVTLADLKGNDITVVATNGDHQLGGKDWDEALIKYISERFIEKHGVDPLEDMAAYHDLRQKCVSAKLSLTQRPKVNLFFDYNGSVLRQEITREKLESLTAHLMARCRLLTEDVLSDADRDGASVDVVLLAGGSTRMPMVRTMIQSMFEKAAATDINPDECVALGAALTAALESARLSGEKPPVDIRTHDVTSHSLGMVVFKGGHLKNSQIIRRNTRIPCERTRDDYVTSHDNQATMDLWLVQGESTAPLECNALGHFEFYGLPERPAGDTRLAVTFKYNENGIVEVECMDLNNGASLGHRLSKSAISLEDLARNNVPLHIALLLDCSGSMYGQSITEARRAAQSFISRTLDGKRTRKVSLVAFPGGLKTPATNNQNLVLDAISKLSPIGSTPMALGLAQARAALKQSTGAQKVFVVLTDGHPDDPDGAIEECHRIRRTGGRIIAVGVGRQVQQDYLRALCADASDYHHCDQAIDLEGTFINLATELSDRA